MKQQRLDVIDIIKFLSLKFSTFGWTIPLEFRYVKTKTVVFF